MPNRPDSHQLRSFAKYVIWGCGVGRTKPPSSVLILIFRTCVYVILHGKFDFADVTKVMDLEMGVSWALSNHAEVREMQEVGGRRD